MFSKLDESLDEVYIPYYNPNENKISNFNPDFIFWLQKGNKYFIVFVDPKGTEHTSALRKIDGYIQLFKKNMKEKVFKHEGFKVKIKLFLRPDQVSKIPDNYRKYSFNNTKKMLEVL